MLRPSVTVAVVMRKMRTSNRWQPWQWNLAEVLPNFAAPSGPPKLLIDNEQEQRWLHAGFEVELYQDDGEGYYLNITTAAPSWWVLWRIEDEPSSAAEPLAMPHAVTLSYHQAGCWLDAQETVEQVAADAATVAWITEFAQVHYQPEVKQRRRPESFRKLDDRYNKSSGK